MKDFEIKYFVFLFFERYAFLGDANNPSFKKTFSYINIPFDTEQDAINHMKDSCRSFFVQKCYIKIKNEITE